MSLSRKSAAPNANSVSNVMVLSMPRCARYPLNADNVIDNPLRWRQSVSRKRSVSASASNLVSGYRGSTAPTDTPAQIVDLSKEDLGGMTLVPNESNIFSWHASLPGPAGSPYEGGVFEVDIRIPEDYP